MFDRILNKPLKRLIYYMGWPTNTYLFKFNNRNSRKSCEKCSILTIKNIINFTSFPNVSFADFEQLNISWVESSQ